MQKSQVCGNVPRLLLNALVRVVLTSSKYFNQVGKVTLHFDEDYSKITIVFGDNYELKIDPKYVKLTDYYYDLEKTSL